MTLRCPCVMLICALFVDLALANQLRASALRASAKASAKALEKATENARIKAHATFKAGVQASAKANMKIHMNLEKLAAKYGAKFGVKVTAAQKLPWPNLDADGGMEYEEGGKRVDESDPHLFSMSQYEHTSATDDADVAETRAIPTFSPCPSTNTQAQPMMQ